MSVTVPLDELMCATHGLEAGAGPCLAFEFGFTARAPEELWGVPMPKPPCNIREGRPPGSVGYLFAIVWQDDLEKIRKYVLGWDVDDNGLVEASWFDLTKESDLRRMLTGLHHTAKLCTFFMYEETHGDFITAMRSLILAREALFRMAEANFGLSYEQLATV